MSNQGLTAGDVLAMTRDNDGFGGVGLIILLFIFLIGLSGNGFGFGNNGTQWGINDIQNSLYNQTQDANARALTAQLATVNDTVLNNKYDNAILIKDLSNQLSNSVAAIGNQIANQTATITNMFNEQTIDHLREVNSNLKDSLSNANQTASILGAINNQTSEILNAQGRYYLNPPCYNGCGSCCNGLY